MKKRKRVALSGIQSNALRKSIRSWGETRWLEIAVRTALQYLLMNPVTNELVAVIVTLLSVDSQVGVHIIGITVRIILLILSALTGASTTSAQSKPTHN